MRYIFENGNSNKDQQKKTINLELHFVDEFNIKKIKRNWES